MKKCCPNCFDDHFLSNEEIPYRSSETGTCSYCKSTKQKLVTPGELRDLFDPVVNVYTKSDSGKSIGSLLSVDWAMFTIFQDDKQTLDTLISDILGSKFHPDNCYALSNKFEKDSAKLWNSFRYELMTKNRYFPKPILDLKQLEKLLSNLQCTLNISDVWYRARIQRGDKPFSKEEMGAPPKELVSNGRANPAGIPYLYLASSELTAIAEARPYTGQKVSVADFQISKKLTFIDLSNPRHTASPFALDDENSVGPLLSDITLLERLDEELSSPVLPAKSDVAYTPSQYLCEFVKNRKYDGLIYNSSVECGKNLSLFEEKNAKAISVKSYEVKKVNINSELVKS